MTMMLWYFVRGLLFAALLVAVFVGVMTALSALVGHPCNPGVSDPWEAARICTARNR